MKRIQNLFFPRLQCMQPASLDEEGRARPPVIDDGRTDESFAVGRSHREQRTGWPINVL